MTRILARWPVPTTKGGSPLDEDPCLASIGTESSRRRRHRRLNGFARIVWLRRRMGVDPHPFSPVPLFKPWSRARWYRLAAELRLAEAAAYDGLGRFLDELEGHAVAMEAAERWRVKRKS